jgi:hypothetical protein
VGATEYLQVRTSRSGSQIVLPVGTTILRVLRDHEGRITRFTSIVKQDAGFFPPSDLFFTVFEPDGQKARESDGTLLEGKLDACMICHRDRAADGYVFGWPDGAIDRAAAQ